MPENGEEAFGRMGFINIITPKQRKRRTLRNNKRRGKSGEQSVKDTDSMVFGWTSKRIHKGGDYIQTRKSILTGGKQQRRVDVKTGDAKLSKLQRKKKAKPRRVNPIGPYW